MGEQCNSGTAYTICEICGIYSFSHTHYNYGEMKIIQCFELFTFSILRVYSLNGYKF